jgi:hypothetical protein
MKTRISKKNSSVTAALRPLPASMKQQRRDTHSDGHVSSYVAGNHIVASVRLSI